MYCLKTQKIVPLNLFMAGKQNKAPPPGFLEEKHMKKKYSRVLTQGMDTSFAHMNKPLFHLKLKNTKYVYL